MTSHNPSDRAIAYWLLICAGTVYFMVVLGGITRLTNSGLSMVDWRPIMGAIPPLTDLQWQETFAQYKQYPEYQKINVGMDLAGFKSIFWFEYSHRLLGRLIGLMYALPLFYFWARKRLYTPLTGKLLVLLLLGGAQGLMGWYMVKSGLVDIPQVSQYRLTAHLSLAVVIIIGLLWVAWDLLLPKHQGRRDHAAYWCAGLVFLTMLSGGFVAGTDAGLLFGTWPLMGDQFFPTGLFASGWIAAFEDPVTIQFDHRMLAYLTTGVLSWFALTRYRSLESHRLAVLMMVALLCVQVSLGIVTLLLRVPVPLAAAHQAVALMLLISLSYLAHRSSK